MQKLLERYAYWNDSQKFRPRPKSEGVRFSSMEPKDHDAVLSYIRQLEKENADLKNTLDGISFAQ